MISVVHTFNMLHVYQHCISSKLICRVLYVGDVVGMWVVGYIKRLVPCFQGCISTCLPSYAKIGQGAHCTSAKKIMPVTSQWVNSCNLNFRHIDKNVLGKDVCCPLFAMAGHRRLGVLHRAQGGLTLDQTPKPPSAATLTHTVVYIPFLPPFCILYS